MPNALYIKILIWRLSGTSAWRWKKIHHAVENLKKKLCCFSTEKKKNISLLVSGGKQFLPLRDLPIPLLALQSQMVYYPMTSDEKLILSES